MAQVQACTAREPHAERVVRDHQIVYGMNCRGRSLVRRTKQTNGRKRPVAELEAMLDLSGIRQMALRPLGAYVPRSPDLHKQLVGLVEHLFVDYSVPPCLYEACMRGEGPFDAHGMYRQWLVAIGQGRSFPRQVKPYMTSREAHLFLSAPIRNRVHENVWWAKLTAAGLPNDVTDTLIDRIFTYHFFDDPVGRLAETISFYGRFHSMMEKVTFGEITDCVTWKLRNEPKFRMAGRTLSSMIKLTNEWHGQMQEAKLRRSLEWPGLQISDWQYLNRDTFWTVCELRTNIELLNEGRTQRHCVFSYVPQCVAGKSAIFSLRAYPKMVSEEGQPAWDKSQEQTRVTIEVNSRRTVVQARGPRNRAPNGDENRILRHWAAEKGLIMGV